MPVQRQRGSLGDKYSAPGRRVTLATRLFMARGIADDLILHDGLADGPGKPVFSCERMRFDCADTLLTWTAGIAERKVSVFRIVSNAPGERGLRLAF